MILKLTPHFVEKLWGNNKLKEIFNLKENKKFGEAWIASGIKDNESKISIDNNLINLNDFYKKNKKLFGNYKSENFPLLIKFLDANDDLSIQVHPNDKQAMKFENYKYGKSEAWYILSLNKNNEIIVGVKDKDTEKLKTLNNDNFRDIVNIEKINVGDAFDIRPGTIHAIMSGTFVYEIQQPSDITYRLFDFERKDDKGVKRQLDIEKSIAVTNINQSPKKVSPKIIKSENLEVQEIINNPIFNLEKWIIKDQKELSINQKKNPFLVVTLIKGKGIINELALNLFETAIVTNDELKKITLKGNFEVLVGKPN